MVWYDHSDGTHGKPQNAPHGGVEAVVVEQRQGVAGVPESPDGGEGDGVAGVVVCSVCLGFGV
jgi:hypothetical protein